MKRILPEIHTLEQHKQQLACNPEAYRPRRCPHCGCAGLWNHGYYQRFPRGHDVRSSEPISIPRFLCPRRECRKSCSTLPECIPPRRWYLWSVQQAMLTLLIYTGLSGEHASPYERTVWRWWARLRACFPIHRFCLATHEAQLGQYESARPFWKRCFKLMPLSRSMFFIHQSQVSIP